MRVIRRILKYAEDIIAPNRCPCCGSFIGMDEQICEGCIKKLAECECSDSYSEGSESPLKGHDLSEEKLTDYCSASVCAYAYYGPAKHGVLALKDSWGRSFAEYSAGVLGRKLQGCNADLITCVPMTKRKKASRGWDQAELIATELSKVIGVPTDFTLLSHGRSTTEQHSLNAAERAEHAKELYSVAEGHTDITGKRLLLVDDVHTTGSTLAACAKLLLSIGAVEIISAAVCRTLKELDHKNT